MKLENILTLISVILLIIFLIFAIMVTNPKLGTKIKKCGFLFFHAKNRPLFLKENNRSVMLQVEGKPDCLRQSGLDVRAAEAAWHRGGGLAS